MQYNIQVLRAFAAYGVVGHHIIDSFHHLAIGRVSTYPQFGATGVNVFFVISGFIMALTTARETTPGQFLYHRIVRIVPIYWLLTALTLGLMACGFALFGNHQGVDLRQAVTSFAFIPDIRLFSESPRPPALFVGWSLNFEMMFYAIFAAALMLRGDKRLVAAGGAVFALWIAHFFSSNDYIRWLGGDVVLGFALGILIWRAAPALPPLAAGLLIPVSLVILASPDLAPQVVLPACHDLVVTAGAGALVMAVVGLERGGRHVRKGFLTSQGDASYSLYLLHPFMLQLVGKLAIWSGLNETPIGLCVVVVAMFVASLFAGTIFHRLIERPITELLRRRDRLRRWRKNSINSDGNLPAEQTSRGALHLDPLDPGFEAAPDHQKG
jgi:exopolysaccharide production protein ExoZ